MTPRDVVECDLDGRILAAAEPGSGSTRETELHLAISLERALRVQAAPE